MTYSKKRTLSYGVILISVLLAYFCRQVRTENVFMRNLAEQCRSCIYLGMYCAWVIYLRRHVVHKKTRRCLTAIGCLMVFWFFVRTVKFHIFHDPLGEHICWYLYYIPMILIPVLGLAAAMFLGEKEEEKTVRKVINHSDQKKQNSGKETVLAASDSGNITSGMEYRKYTPPAFHQNHCRGYDGSVLPFNGSNFSGLYIMWIDTDQ